VFKEPAEVLACADLDVARKHQILERWRHDALELQTAGDEATSGGEAPMMQRVNDALLELERQTGVGAPHKRSITSWGAAPHQWPSGAATRPRPEPVQHLALTDPVGEHRRDDDVRGQPGSASVWEAPCPKGRSSLPSRGGLQFALSNAPSWPAQADKMCRLHHHQA
jgi:hypothetical protein